MSKTQSHAQEVLRSARSILLVDWPSRELPEKLAKAGYEVIVRGGPDPLDYAKFEASDGEVAVTEGLEAPEAVDLLYVYRPIDEVAPLVEMGQTMMAKTLWYQSGLTSGGQRSPQGCWLSDGDSNRNHDMAESRGMAYLDQPSILEVLSTLE